MRLLKLVKGKADIVLIILITGSACSNYGYFESAPKSESPGPELNSKAVYYSHSGICDDEVIDTTIRLKYPGIQKAGRKQDMHLVKRYIKIESYITSRTINWPLSLLYLASYTISPALNEKREALLSIDIIEDYQVQDQLSVRNGYHSFALWGLGNIWSLFLPVKSPLKKEAALNSGVDWQAVNKDICFAMMHAMLKNITH